MMSGFYGIESNREVIRVLVKKFDGLLQPEMKRFSLDPQITSFEMLQNILARAFDIKTDFSISYLSTDRGQEVYLSMLSDWDMDAAFQNASDPCLRLKVDLKPFDEALEDWDIIVPVEVPQYRVSNFLAKSSFLGNLTGSISNQMERTVSHVQKAIGLKSEEDHQFRAMKAPMTDMEFHNYLDSDGHMVRPEEFRLSIYQGGVEHSLRRVVWRHLLNIYPADLSGKERFDYMKKREREYFRLRDTWKALFSSGKASEEAKHVASLVKKDVLRTDRTHKFYAGGDESKNLISLFNLLVTYALTHPDVSYCQGMSDIASPLLVVQKEEAQAYLCFCGLMKRLSANFLYDEKAITMKFAHLTELLTLYDPVFEEYLQKNGADDLFFCYRWLLLEMKREFPFEDSMYMQEVMWSTLPPDPPEGPLKLTDHDYHPALLSVSPHSPTFSVRQTLYSQLLAKRRAILKKDALVTKCQSPTQKEERDLSNSVNNNNSIDTAACNSSDNSSSSSTSTAINEIVTSSFTDKSCVENDSPQDSSVSETNESVNGLHRKMSSSAEDRFPSLISSGHFEQSTSLSDVVDDETEVISSGCSAIDSERAVDQSESQASHNDSKHDINHTEESQSQFYLSLEETDYRKQSKPDNIPQIKGSFFSGMKKILSSPKKKPGRVQQVHANPKVSLTATTENNNWKQCDKSVTNVKANQQNGSKNKFPITGTCSRSMTVSDDELESSENLLFNQANKQDPMHITTDKLDTDSGNSSLTHSDNSSNTMVVKHELSNCAGSLVNKQISHSEPSCKVNNRKTSQSNCVDGQVDERNNYNLPEGKYPVFCENHFDDLERSEEIKDVPKDDGIADCVEVTDEGEIVANRLKELPPPNVFGYANPFLMFLCLTVLVQHRDHILRTRMEYDELAMYFDKMVRKHDVHKVLHQTRAMYTDYLRVQQKLQAELQDETDFSSV